VNSQEIKHTRLYEQVIIKLEQDFSKGLLKIGDRLASERESAEHFNISRGTLRDAFRVLESQGIIETIPGDGRYLRKSLDEMERSEHPVIEDLKKAAMLDLIETREIIETGMIGYVCERATDKDILRLEYLALQMNKGSTSTGEPDADYYFHHALAECSKNSAILNFMKLNMEIINQTREKNFARSNNFEQAQKEHIAIVEAIKNRDAQIAKQKVLEHFNHIRKRMNN
jgi:GntR family transcriptional repressor for pyruvate dehydrogenase complex